MKTPYSHTPSAEQAGLLCVLEVGTSPYPIWRNCYILRNGGHVYYWGDVHLRNFGEKRGNHISPAADALHRGISVNFHQDTPVSAPNMLHSIWCGINRIIRSGRVIGADQLVSVYDALKAATIEGAREYFEEDSKRSIMFGRRADLVILDRSPLEIDPMEIQNIRVLETIKDGETIHVAEG